MKTLNIYISKKTKQDLQKLRNKYKVSLSTLTGKIVYYFHYSILHYPLIEDWHILENDYIDKTEKDKTSVKPREVMETLNNEIEKKSCYVSNVLYIVTNKLLKNYIDEKGINKFYNKIDQELTKCLDIYWDYNRSIRNQRRSIRQNKEYWRKALEDV